MNSRLASFLLLALALILAPLGICAGGGMAAAAPSHAAGIHHAPQAGADHSHHRRPDKLHFCPECQPPSFVKAGKTAAQDVAPSTQAVAPAPFVQAFIPATAKPDWRRVPASRPPPLRRTYRIRLQI